MDGYGVSGFEQVRRNSLVRDMAEGTISWACKFKPGVWLNVLYLTSVLVLQIFVFDTLIAVAVDDASERLAFFENRIRPVLVNHCYQCHSAAAARESELEGGLQLDTRQGVLLGGDSGEILVPGSPSGSLLIQRLTTEDDDVRMPPEGRLPNRVIADFRHWVSMGAPDPRDGSAVDVARLKIEAGRQHWAYRRFSSRRLPSENDQPAMSIVDQFINAKLRSKKLRPTPRANKHTLIRRLYFDLIGLPPSPKAVEAFVSNSSINAYEQLVEKLLADPRFGERWGRHWLDVARFGETSGNTDEEDFLIEDAYRYRDAVIEAFNQDMPWDEFVRHQIAGSSREENTPASGLGMFLQLGTRLNDNSNPNDRQFHILDDMVSTTGQAFLATTVGCARCHDHKIDPITAEEYYQWTAVFFDQTHVKPDAGGKHVSLQITRPHLLANGSWDSPVKPVSAGGLRVLMGEEGGGFASERWFRDDRVGREAFAHWITDVDHGAGTLLARVIVNRLWHYHFGRGLVATTNDFGQLGTAPTHPELLDWLAEKLIQEKWHLKSIHRVILGSAAYQRSAGVDATQSKRDALSEYYWQRLPRRMEAEAIRDSLLAVAGKLRSESFGPSVPIGNRRRPFRDTPDTWRRSIYLMSPRMDRHPVLKVFDLPDNEFSIGVRGVSTTPASALFMMNAPFVLEQAKHFAERVDKEIGVAENDAKKVDHVYAIALSRPPTDEERRLGQKFLSRGVGQDGESFRAFERLVEYCHAIVGLNEFIYVQ